MNRFPFFTASSIAALWKTYDVVLLRGFTSKDAWQLATELDRCEKYGSGVIVLTPSVDMTTIGRCGGAQDDEQMGGIWFQRSPLSTHSGLFARTVLREHERPVNAMLCVPRTVDDVVKACDCVLESYAYRLQRSLQRAKLVILLDHSLLNVVDLETAAHALFRDHCSAGPTLGPLGQDWEKIIEKVGRLLDSGRVFSSLELLHEEELWTLANEMSVAFSGKYGRAICYTARNEVASLGKVDGKESIELTASLSPLITNRKDVLKELLCEEPPSGAAHSLKIIVMHPLDPIELVWVANAIRHADEVRNAQLCANCCTRNFKVLVVIGNCMSTVGVQLLHTLNAVNDGSFPV